MNSTIYVIQYFGGDFPRANPAWKSLWTIGNDFLFTLLYNKNIFQIL